ncbi:PIN domain-containing protein [Gloeobacter violaceus]|uniref:PIN domain-containing protein n=1 Tax=Gloeobacter violaceus TaxID=33072 RepID=UPI0013E8EB24|nr:PIN domain-containing protein [Gloeobacter violaceus]
MRIIISDSSCLIDLHKVALIDALLQLPYEVVIPDLLFADELLSFSAEERKAMILHGLKVLSLPGEGVVRASDLSGRHPRLSLYDCFALVLAERTPGCILLTGDNELRRLAGTQCIEVHGVLWAIDEMHRVGAAASELLYLALQSFEVEPTVRLPRSEIQRRLALLRKNLLP